MVILVVAESIEVVCQRSVQVKKNRLERGQKTHRPAPGTAAVCPLDAIIAVSCRVRALLNRVNEI
jgi:hypothetical protein